MRKLIVLQATLLILFCGTESSFGQTVSEEAKRHFDRGMAAVEMAKSPDDYVPAIKEFEQAKSLAPNWPNVYYNLGLVQEKAGQYSDAITNLKQYLRLAPNASNAETVKSLINKLEYKKDQEEGVKRVYEMMTSGSYEKIPVGDCKKNGDERVRTGPGCISLTVFRMVSGEMQVERCESSFNPEFEYHPELHPPTRKWNPVKVNGRFYEYAHSSYMDVSSGYTVRYDSEVKGEIISIDPPRVKEITNISDPWGASIPFPGGRDAGRPPWSDNSHATTECVFEWKPIEGSMSGSVSLSNTPLHNAVILGRKDEAESSNAGGQEVDARLIDCRTPLGLAISYGHKDEAKSLIARGADVNLKGSCGYTPLIFAVMNDDKEMVELLIAKGADVNTKDRTSNRTPLKWAEALKHQDMADLLLKHGAK